MKKHLTLSLIALALLGNAPPGYASENEAAKRENDKTTAEDVRKETADAAEAIKNYTADKRDEAAKKAKTALDDLDAQISALEARIDQDWDKMDKAAREQARNTLKALHKQQVQAAEWYGGLKNSTANAWEHMKKGFSDAYTSLQHAWENAAQEYEKEDQQK